MMSTTGRIPVIAAPSPMPVMPASEIGESITRSGPNSSTSPDRTLNGVPASATSSPITNTDGSRRISSASASFTAWPSDSSRVASIVATLGVDMLVHLGRVRKRGRERERHAGGDLGLDLGGDPGELELGRRARVGEPLLEQRDRVAVGTPIRLFLLGAVVAPVDVPDVVAVVAVRRAEEKARTCTGPCAGHGALGCPEDGDDVLAVDLLRRDSERAGARGHVARRRLRPVRVLVVEVVLADVDDRQLPERGHVHHLVEEPLAECALAEEADGHLVAAAHLRRERCTGGDPGRAADDRVRAEVAVLVVGDVHRAALAPAVAGLLAEQLRVHAVGRGALGEAVPVAAMRGGDVVVAPQGLANPYRDRFLADVEMGEARHLRS